MSAKPQVWHSDPQTLGGIPVFVGTRVPVQSLFDYLEGGETLEEVLGQFPSVKREQAIAARAPARGSLLAGARSTGRAAAGRAGDRIHRSRGADRDGHRLAGPYKWRSVTAGSHSIRGLRDDGSQSRVPAELVGGGFSGGLDPRTVKPHA